mmetsp:Transcript_64145/g.165115  ORF Transcript_64145/g.165115 Transcript_64145/m.165115 type:complete len:159 (-) Transcript_64145:44-520(-)
MGSLEDEGNNAAGTKIKELYFDILNCKGTKTAYAESDHEEEERKHVKKLNKRRAKELRKQQKKLEVQDQRFAKGEDNSDEDVPFFMQDASIRAAMRERALEKQLEAKKRKRKKGSSSSDSDSDSSSEDKKKKKKKDKKKKEKQKNKKTKKKKSGSSSS